MCDVGNSLMFTETASSQAAPPIVKDANGEENFDYLTTAGLSKVLVIKYDNWNVK